MGNWAHRDWVDSEAMSVSVCVSVCEPTTCAICAVVLKIPASPKFHCPTLN